jgi:protein TonB
MFKSEKLKLVETVVLVAVFCVIAVTFVVRANLQIRKHEGLVFFPVQEVVIGSAAQTKAVEIVKPLPPSAITVLPVVPPQVLNAVLPEYPALAKEQGSEGVTLLKVYIEPSGKAGQVELVGSSGNQLLDETASKAVRNWDFSPAKQGTVAIGSWLEIPVRFELTS